MNILFIEYPTCSTCKKAKKFLLEHGVNLKERHIIKETPTEEELHLWYKNSKLELKKFFNTSGKMYKEMKLKDKLPYMSEDEQIHLLASNGMLIKRPLVIYHDQVIVGFQEDKYEMICSEC